MRKKSEEVETDRRKRETHLKEIREKSRVKGKIEKKKMKMETKIREET